MIGVALVAHPMAAPTRLVTLELRKLVGSQERYKKGQTIAARSKWEGIEPR
jgi:hypothetical protein